MINAAGLDKAQLLRPSEEQQVVPVLGYQPGLELGPGSKLSEAIRAASNREIDIGDVDGQLRFVDADIAEEMPLLLMRSSGSIGGARHLLAGHSLGYRIAAYHQRNQACPPQRRVDKLLIDYG